MISFSGGDLRDATNPIETATNLIFDILCTCLAARMPACPSVCLLPGFVVWREQPHNPRNPRALTTLTTLTPSHPSNPLDPRDPPNPHALRHIRARNFLTKMYHV